MRAELRVISLPWSAVRQRLAIGAAPGQIHGDRGIAVFGPEFGPFGKRLAASAVDQHDARVGWLVGRAAERGGRRVVGKHAGRMSLVGLAAIRERVDRSVLFEPGDGRRASCRVVADPREWWPAEERDRQPDATGIPQATTSTNNAQRRRDDFAMLILLDAFPQGRTSVFTDSMVICRSHQGDVQTLTDEQHVFFLDINAKFLDDQGTLPKDLMPDLLHPNEKGYEIWAVAMEPRSRSCWTKNRPDPN